MQAYSESQLDTQLKHLGVAADAARMRASGTRIDFSGAPVFSLAALIPLILVLMTVTGAVYPAIDLTAGERERGTLEMLIAAPVPRVGLLLAKYVAVLAVALLTALVNLTGMAITSHSTGLNVSLFGGAGLSLPVVIKVLLLLALFAAFFSAVLLAITSCARSFKEAQAYIIPLMLLCLVPGVICLMPSLQFTGLLAVVPLVNIVLLARDLLEGSVDPLLASVGGDVDGVLRRGGDRAWRRGSSAPMRFSTAANRRGPTFSAGRPRRRRRCRCSAAALSLAVMFPAYFVLSATLAQSREISLDRAAVRRRDRHGARVLRNSCGDRAVESRARGERHRPRTTAIGVALAGGDVGLRALARCARVVPAQRADRHHRIAARSVGRSQSISGAVAARFASSGSCWRWRLCRACARSFSFAACCSRRCGR